MEKIILGYCGAMVVIVASILCCVLFYEKDSNDKESLPGLDKVVLAGALLIALMIIHLNWISLPFYSLKLGTLPAFSAVGILTFLLITPFVLIILRHRSKNASNFSDAYIDEDGIIKYRLS